MVDTAQIRDIIKASGMKAKFVAKVLGMSPQSLHNKLSGRTEFKVGEMQAFCKLFELTETQRKSIFFVQNSELHSLNKKEA